MQWLFWQMAGLRPMFCHSATSIATRQSRSRTRRSVTKTEVLRLLTVLDKQLGITGAYMAGEYSIADMVTWPWVNAFRTHAAEHVKMDEYAFWKNASPPRHTLPLDLTRYGTIERNPGDVMITRWLQLDEIGKRPAVVKGKDVLPMAPPPGRS